MTKCFALGLLCGLLPLLGQAEERKPRWEAGVGLASVSVPDYRGSDERTRYTLPFPFFVYRGDVLKADREGARAQLIGIDTLHMDLNLGLSNPVSSKHNQARAGMPNRPAVIDIGPSLDAQLYRSSDERTKLKAVLSTSYGVTVGSRAGGNGWSAAPKLKLEVQDALDLPGWTWMVQTGPIYGTGQRFAYYYDVPQAYATVDRPAYRAHGGYGGVQFTTALSKRFERYWVGAFARYDNLSGATFTDSPLVKTRQYLAVGVAAAWVFGQSSEMTTSD